MRQSKLESALEATINIASGFFISWAVWLWVVPVFFGPNVGVSVGSGFFLTTIFTVSSWLRSYIWRRFFNAGVHRAVHAWCRGVR